MSALIAWYFVTVKDIDHVAKREFIGWCVSFRFVSKRVAILDSLGQSMRLSISPHILGAKYTWTETEQNIEIDRVPSMLFIVAVTSCPTGCGGQGGIKLLPRETGCLHLQGKLLCQHERRSMVVMENSTQSRLFSGWEQFFASNYIAMKVTVLALCARWNFPAQILRNEYLVHVSTFYRIDADVCDDLHTVFPNVKCGVAA